MISVEEYLGQQTNFELEKAVREYLMLSKRDTLENTSSRPVDSTYTLNTDIEFIYNRDFLEECFSDVNPNWVDGTLKDLINLNNLDGSDRWFTED
jgi:hypothetical protein|tara:strand:+ start:307 stop:591 length:285 start_codon:yes stop_codon:yes gene_type:complete